MSVFSIISPLILITLCGYVSGKYKWLTKDQLDGISKLTFYGFIPTYLFYQMAKADINSQLSFSLFATFYIPVLICYGIAFFINYFFHHKDKKSPASSAVFGLNASYSNNIIVGLPVLLLAIGEQVLPIVFVIVTFHSAMLFGITGALAATSDGFKWRNFIIQNLKNPLIIGILSGLTVNILGITLSSIVDNSLLLFSKPAVTLALFVLGSSIAFYRITDDKRYTILATLIKILLLPIIVFIAATFIFNLPALTTKVLVLLSACPTGVNAYLIAKNYDYHQSTVASTVVVSTVLSAFTIPLWLLFLNV